VRTTRVQMAVCDTTHDTPRSDAENREIAELALRGVQLLCAWTSDVVEMVCVWLNVLPPMV
jgi:hypothetical protein